MSKIPTAEEFAIQNGFPKELFKNSQYYKVMIEFAKHHVTEASKAYFEEIKKEGLVTEAGIAYLERVYPLTNKK